MTITNSTPSNIVIEKFPVAKDSLKFAGLEKSFNIVDIVPTTDIIGGDIDPQYSAQINNILPTLNALQTAKKSLSDVQSIVKDIKSNYKTEKNDNYAPIDDTMLRQRYQATLQIKDIFANAKYNHQNVFTMDYSDKDITLDLGRKDLSKLNLRDEHSINIFSDNITALSNQIEGEIAKLQQQIDKIEQSRWLSMESLRNVRLEQKAVNESLKNANATPSLASALAQVAAQTSGESTNKTSQANDTQDSNISVASANPDTEQVQDSQANINDNNVIVGIAKPSTQNQLDSAVESVATSSNNAPQTKETTQDSTNAATTNQQDNTQESQNLATDSKPNATTQTANANTAQSQAGDSQASNAQSQESQPTNTQNTQNQATNNVANNAQNTQDSQNNVIGVVSGDEKEQVVDLYM